MLKNLQTNLILIYQQGKYMIALATTTVIGLIYLWDPTYLWISLVGYCLFGMLGLEIAHHRYYCHKSFVAKNKFVEWILYVCSIYSGCGGPIYYSGLHRTHHMTADTDKDPHRPFDQPFLSAIHCNDRTRSTIDWSIVRDLTVHKELMFLTRNHMWIYFSTIGLAAIINLKFALYFFVIPALFTMLVAGLVNTVSHMWGYRNFETNDHNRNNLFVNLLGFGVGLHNNHHYNSRRYTTRVKWHEIDISGLIIKYILAKEVYE